MADDEYTDDLDVEVEGDAQEEQSDSDTETSTETENSDADFGDSDNSEEDTYQCEKCDEEFNSLSEYMKHLETHVKVKPQSAGRPRGRPPKVVTPAEANRMIKEAFPEEAKRAEAARIPQKNNQPTKQPGGNKTNKSSYLEVNTQNPSAEQPQVTMSDLVLAVNNLTTVVAALENRVKVLEAYLFRSMAQ